MKSTKIMILFAVTAVLFISPSFATAGMHRGAMGHPGAGPRWIGMRVLLELKLTPSQQEEMLDIISRFEKEGEALHDAARLAGRNLASVMRAENFDEAALRQAYREVASAREEVLVFKGRMRRELKRLLTPEQMETIDRVKSERKGKWKKRMRAWGAKGKRIGDPGTQD